MCQFEPEKNALYAATEATMFHLMVKNAWSNYELTAHMSTWNQNEAGSYMDTPPFSCYLGAINIYNWHSNLFLLLFFTTLLDLMVC